jgi:hypothetical protein
LKALGETGASVIRQTTASSGSISTTLMTGRPKRRRISTSAMVWQRAKSVPSPSKQQKNFTKAKTRGLTPVMPTAFDLGNASLSEGPF